MCLVRAKGLKHCMNKDTVLEHCVVVKRLNYSCVLAIYQSLCLSRSGSWEEFMEGIRVVNGVAGLLSLEKAVESQYSRSSKVLHWTTQAEIQWVWRRVYWRLALPPVSLIRLSLAFVISPGRKSCLRGVASMLPSATIPFCVGVPVKRQQPTSVIIEMLQ